MSESKNRLAAMINQAISTADVTATDHQGTNAGFIDVMSSRNLHIQKDIPAAYEMYALLQHYSDSLPLFDNAPTELKPGIYIDDETQSVVAMIAIPEDMLTYVAYWITDSLHSAEVKKMPGLLVVPFGIEKHNDHEMLIPEWFAVFYVDAKIDHCMPILALRSVTEDERFGDWVDVALNRMAYFNLPAQTALNEVKRRSHV